MSEKSSGPRCIRCGRISSLSDLCGWCQRITTCNVSLKLRHISEEMTLTSKSTWSGRPGDSILDIKKENEILEIISADDDDDSEGISSATTVHRGCNIKESHHSEYKISSSEAHFPVIVLFEPLIDHYTCEEKALEAQIDGLFITNDKTIESCCEHVTEYQKKRIESIVKWKFPEVWKTWIR